MRLLELFAELKADTSSCSQWEVQARRVGGQECGAASRATQQQERGCGGAAGCVRRALPTRFRPIAEPDLALSAASDEGSVGMELAWLGRLLVYDRLSKLRNSLAYLRSISRPLDGPEWLSGSRLLCRVRRRRRSRHRLSAWPDSVSQASMDRVQHCVTCKTAPAGFTT